MHTLTIDALQAELNRHCVRFAPQIRSALRQELEFESFLPFVSAEHTYTAENVSVGDILQPYQHQHTPNNTEAWNGVSNTLQHGKTDLIFTAEQLEKFYDKWRCNWFELGKNPIEWSYPRYILEVEAMPKLIEEINIASYSGVRVDPTPGTPGGFKDSWDGYGKKVEDAIVANEITPIATGAFTDNTMVAQIRAFCKALPQLYRYREGIIYMSKTNAQRYADDYQAKYPSRKVNEEHQDKLYLRVDHMNKRIIGLNCMEGSNRIIVNFPNLNNMIIGNRTGQSLYPQFRFQEFDRSLKVFGEMSRFYGFEYWQHVFVNDQV